METGFSLNIPTRDNKKTRENARVPRQKENTVKDITATKTPKIETIQN